MIFQEKCFSSYILLSDQISMPDCLHFLRYWSIYVFQLFVEGALSGLRQFLITESPLIIMKNAIYFTLEVLLVLKIFNFWSWLFGHVENVTRLERQG